jgi:two-component system, cell cycle response regulator
MGKRVGGKNDNAPEVAGEPTQPRGQAMPAIDRVDRDSLTPSVPIAAVPFVPWDDPDEIPARPTEDTSPASTPPVCDRPTLTMITGPEAGSIYVVSRNETWIGRASDCHIRLDDLGASRRHAKIVREKDGAYAIEDNDSRNGTTVRGEPVVRHRLGDGDRIGLGPNVFIRFSFTDRNEEEMLRRRYESSILDPLTGVLNRGHFTDRLDSEIAYARRHATPLSLLMIDVDDFKTINDSLGHQAGDFALTSMCAAVKASLRVEDVFARYGGEEFAVIARGIDIGEAVKAAERVRALIEATEIVYQAALIRLTVSIGVASLACCAENAQNREELIRLADERMYAAKGAGRNRCVGRTGAD